MKLGYLLSGNKETSFKGGESGEMVTRLEAKTTPAAALPRAGLSAVSLEDAS